MATLTSRNATLSRTPAWIAPAGGAVAGIAAAAICLLLPQTLLEDWVWQSGLPGLIAVTEPPLGTTARAVLALGAGALAAAVSWSALFLLIGPDGLFAPRPVTQEGVPVLRRADAHPDAPARKPLSAADLGAPMPPMHDGADPVSATIPAPIAVATYPQASPPPPVVQAIPVDLDMPLAAFHPGAMPAVPREPVRPVASLRPVAPTEDERIATVEPPPAPMEEERIIAVEPPPTPIEPPAAPIEPTGAPSIEALLRRLEESTRRPMRA